MRAPTKNTKKLIVFRNAVELESCTNGTLFQGRAAAVDAALMMAHTSGKRAYVVQPNGCVLEVDGEYITGAHTTISPSYEDIFEEVMKDTTDVTFI